MVPDVIIFIFWMLILKPAFSLSSFPFIKRLFSSYSFSAIRVVSSVCLKLMIFLPAILIPACPSSSPAFHMMYSAYKLNKQGGNILPKKKKKKHCLCTSLKIKALRFYTKTAKVVLNSLYHYCENIQIMLVAVFNIHHLKILRIPIFKNIK